MKTIFFDSWGNPWEVCSADAEEAEAFGPCFTARRRPLPHLREVPPELREEDENGWVFLGGKTRRAGKVEKLPDGNLRLIDTSWDRRGWSGTVNQAVLIWEGDELFLNVYRVR
jgi:hypothetical protein